MKFSKDSKNVLKTLIFLLKQQLTVQTMTPLFSLTVPNFVLFFQVIE